MDSLLIKKRNKKQNRGTECWLITIYEPDGITPVLTVTNAPEDVTYSGNVYTSYNVSVEEPPAYEGEGLPTAKLKISNVTLVLQASMAASDYYRGGRCVFLAYNIDEPDVDYTDDLKELQIISHETTLHSISFTLAAPKELVEYVPEDLYGPFSCRHKFNYARCGYTSCVIDGITLGVSAPVKLTVNSQSVVTGDIITISGNTSVTPSLDGTHTVTRIGATQFSLDNTAGVGYAIASPPGLTGTFSHSACGQTRRDCLGRDRIEAFGGMCGLRSDTIIVGQI